MYKSPEYTEAELASYATKTCLSLAMDCFNQPPLSLVASKHYCFAATKENLGEFLNDDRYNGIIFRPSSQHGYTTFCFKGATKLINIASLNSWLNELNSFYSYYKLSLSDEIVSVINSIRNNPKLDEMIKTDTVPKNFERELNGRHKQAQEKIKNTLIKQANPFRMENHK